MRTPGLGLSRRNSTRGVLPIAWTMSPYLPPQGLLSRRGSSTSESVVTGIIDDEGVVVRVRRGAAAQEAERLRARVPQLVGRSGRDHHGVAGRHVGLVVAQLHPAAARREEVDLLGDAVVVLLGLRAGRHCRLGQALVRRVAGRGAGQLADLRAVLRDERLRRLESLLAHRSEATSVAHLGDVRPYLIRAVAAVAREPHALVER